MTVRTRVEKLEKAMPENGFKDAVLLVCDEHEGDAAIEKYCIEHGVSADDHSFICVLLVKPPAHLLERE